MRNKPRIHSVYDIISSMLGIPKNYLVYNILATFLGSLLLMVVLLGIEKLIWKPITLYVSMFLFIIFTFIMFTYGLNPRELVRNIDKDISKGETVSNYLFGIPYLQFGAFVLLCQSMWLAGWSNFQILPSSVSFWTWVLYGLDNLLGVISFDFFQVYGFSLSHVEHAQTFAMSTLVFSYRLSLTISLLKILLLSYRKIITKQVPQHSNRQKE